MTKDDQIKDLQAELERTAKYAEKVTRERDRLIAALEKTFGIGEIEANMREINDAVNVFGVATIPHLGEIR